MADEYDRREGAANLKRFAGELTSIQRGLDTIISFYSDQTPKDEADEREYMRGMWKKLAAQRDAINSLMDRL